MKVSSKRGAVTRARIEKLRLRVESGDTRSAKALATAVASRLALRVGDLSDLAGRESVRVRVTTTSSMSRQQLAESIAGRISNSQAKKQGRR
jgi:hypothetical protein